MLQAAGVPTPATYVAEHARELAPLLDAGSLVVKPYEGAGGHHVRVVHSAAELSELPHEDREFVFARRYHPPRGRDRKIYVIGDELFAVKKIFPRRTEEDKLGEPFALTPELREISF